MDQIMQEVTQDFQLDPWVLLLQLSLAMVVGVIIAFHPSQLKKILSKPKKLQNAQAQVLLCIAGALLINVIGDSAARAFGIFGIGSFVRFRAPVKSPIDAAKMFMLLGLGMALGMGLYMGAAVSTVFLFFVLYLIALLKPKESTSESSSV